LGVVPWEDNSPEIYSEGDILAAGDFCQTYDCHIVAMRRSRTMRGNSHLPIVAVAAHQVPIAQSANAKVTAIVWSTSPVAGWERILEDGAEPDNVGKTEARVLPMRSIA
jgi:hypothetical protein